MITYIREQHLHNLQLKINDLRPEYKGKISDGYHTFDELYEHRITLYIALCKSLRMEEDVWKSKQHLDGTRIEGWFILGINKEEGKQITYHLPLSKWDECDFAKTLATAPNFDGHNLIDVLERLKNLL